MNSLEELFSAFQFALLPFLGLLVMSVFLNILSVLMVFKKESIVAVVYPQTVQALFDFFTLLFLQIGGATLIKFKNSSADFFTSIVFILVMSTICILHLFYSNVKFNFLKRFFKINFTIKDKQHFLFFLLIVSMNLSLFISFILPENDYLNRFLNGEMLAFSLKEMLVLSLVTCFFLVFFIYYHKYFLSYALDESYYKIHLSLKKKIILWSYHFFLILGIALSAFCFGAFLTIAILTLPAFFYLRQANSLKSYFLLIFVNNFLGITLGIFLALVFNLPPVIMIVMALIILGFFGKIVYYFKCINV